MGQTVMLGYRQHLLDSHHRGCNAHHVGLQSIHRDGHTDSKEDQQDKECGCLGELSQAPGPVLAAVLIESKHVKGHETTDFQVLRNSNC